MPILELFYPALHEAEKMILQQNGTLRPERMGVLQCLDEWLREIEIAQPVQPQSCSEAVIMEQANTYLPEISAHKYTSETALADYIHRATDLLLCAAQIENSCSRTAMSLFLQRKVREYIADRNGNDQPEQGILTGIVREATFAYAVLKRGLPLKRPSAHADVHKKVDFFVGNMSRTGYIGIDVKGALHPMEQTITRTGKIFPNYKLQIYVPHIMQKDLSSQLSVPDGTYIFPPHENRRDEIIDMLAPLLHTEAHF